jgi:hypothetical protein
VNVCVQVCEKQHAKDASDRISGFISATKRYEPHIAAPIISR